MTDLPMNQQDRFCPYRQQNISACACYDLYLIACDLFEDDTLVPPQDKDRLRKICEACGHCFD